MHKGTMSLWISTMRCYFTRSDTVQGVSFIRAASDDDLVAKAKELFAKKSDEFDGCEVWHGDRFICRFSRDQLPPKGADASIA